MHPGTQVVDLILHVQDAADALQLMPSSCESRWINRSRAMSRAE